MANPSQFAGQYGPLAAQIGQRLGVDPTILLGQWGLETGWGKSVIPGTNNLGNIKDFSGGGVGAIDNMTGSDDKYLAFDTPQAFADHYAGLIERKYPNAVGAGNDPQAFARALKQGGYAQDPAYVSKMVSAANTVRQQPGIMDQIAAAIFPAAHAQQLHEQQADMYANASAQKQPTPWKAVIAKPEYQALSAQDKVAAQEQYFSEVVAPRVPKDQVEAAKAQFFEQYAPPAVAYVPHVMPLNQENKMGPTQEELDAVAEQDKRAQASALSRAAVENSLRSPFGGSTPIQGTKALGAGLGQGFGQVALGAQHYLGRGLQGVGFADAGDWLVNDAAQGRAKLETEAARYAKDDPYAAALGRIGGNVVSAAPVAGLLSRVISAGAPLLGAAAPVVARLGTAARTGGATTGVAKAPGIGHAVTDMGLRILGGGATGAATAGLIDPDSAATGGMIGAALPPALLAAGTAGKAIGAAVRPFYGAGQNRIAGDILREFATNPKAAQSQLQNAQPVISGSMPTTAMAAGDDGLAALSRAMQNADTRYASELASRQTAQNQARTAAIEDMAGNTGKIDLATKARDALTAPMREAVLDAAGSVPSGGLLQSIDRMLANPNNAGKLAQQALGELRNRIAQFSDSGVIDARALYAIRKDIGETLGGKLQGEAGNLRYASKQLINVRGLIDDAIDKASRRVSAPGTQVMPYGSNISTHTFPNPASTGPRPTWSDYLKTYAQESVPINQMKKLDDILRKIQTGSVDKQGSAILSAPKLNNLLKNEGKDLAKLLSSDQMDLLRKLAADLNASQIAANTGRAVGSNTLQNIAQNNFLSKALGHTLGGSSLAQTTLGRFLQLPYGIANKQIQERLGNALLNPQEAAGLLSSPQASAFIRSIQAGAPIGYRAAPVLTAQ